MYSVGPDGRLWVRYTGEHYPFVYATLEPAVGCNTHTTPLQAGNYDCDEVGFDLFGVDAGTYTLSLFGSDFVDTFVMKEGLRILVQVPLCFPPTVAPVPPTPPELIVDGGDANDLP